MKQGYKITKVRETILQILSSTATPLSVSEILLKLKAKKLTPNKTTVYREIEFLTGLNLVSSVDFGDGKKRYERISDHHHHIVCITCKKVVDIPMARDLDIKESQILTKFKFKPVGHSLEFFGLCQNCQ